MDASALFVRAFAGATIVSLFALLSDALTPKSFAGLFGAAPSVALASLALTYHSKGAGYVATEALWMVAGTMAFAVYAYLVCRLLRNARYSVRTVATATLIVWLVVALGVWRIIAHANPS